MLLMADWADRIAAGGEPVGVLRRLAGGPGASQARGVKRA